MRVDENWTMCYCILSEVRTGKTNPVRTFWFQRSERIHAALDARLHLPGMVRNKRMERKSENEWQIKSGC